MTGAQSFLEKGPELCSDRTAYQTGDIFEKRDPADHNSVAKSFRTRVVLSTLCQIALEPGVLGLPIVLSFRVRHAREKQALQSALFRLCAVTVNYGGARHAGLLLPLHFNSQTFIPASTLLAPYIPGISPLVPMCSFTTLRYSFAASTFFMCTPALFANDCACLASFMARSTANSGCSLLQWSPGGIRLEYATYGPGNIVSINWCNS
jgi:hypothetical protein